LTDIHTFEGFLDSSLGRAWVYEPGIRLYLRKPIAGIRGPNVDVEIAAVEADQPGQGAFTRFLDEHEPHFGFYVQLIHNERLVPYLARRGYVIVSSREDAGVPSMQRERPANSPRPVVNRGAAQRYLEASSDIEGRTRTT
jgi:hypothetical protein